MHAYVVYLPTNILYMQYLMDFMAVDCVMLINAELVLYSLNMLIIILNGHRLLDGQ